MAVVLTLGGIVFQDFEIPERINAGGSQMLAIHKLPGGNRVIDAMGPDDDEIRWSGRFRGSDATTRAQFLNFMRRAGQQILLSWSVYRYQVVIEKFEANFEQEYEIPYSISCAVVIDEIMALASAAVGLVESLAADLVNAVGLSSVIGVPAINTAVLGVGAAVTNLQAGVPASTNAVAGITNATEGSLLTATLSSISGAQTATQSAISTTGSALNTTGSVAGVTPGGSPASMAASLSSQTQAMGQLSQLYQLSSTLSRMGTNVTNAGN